MTVERAATEPQMKQIFGLTSSRLIAPLRDDHGLDGMLALF